MKSKEWHKTRDRIRQERKICEICQSEEDLHVHHLTYENIGNEKEDELLLVCKKCHYSIHKGYYLILRNVKGQEFIKNNKSDEILNALKYTKIVEIYFQKDKTLLVNGKYFCCIRRDGNEEELEDKKWYFMDKTKWKDIKE